MSNCRLVAEFRSVWFKCEQTRITHEKPFTNKLFANLYSRQFWDLRGGRINCANDIKSFDQIKQIKHSRLAQGW